MKNIKRIIAGAIAVISLVMVNPIKANAEWKSNSSGWWYKEGESYATGWKKIDGKWYYFYSNGYMAHDTVIEGYYLNSSGQWIENNEITDAENKVKQYLLSRGMYVPKYVKYDHDDGNNYVIHCYDIIIQDNSEHTSTSGWYLVDKTSGSIRSMF